MLGNLFQRAKLTGNNKSMISKKAALSKPSLFIVIMLDLLVMAVLFSGLSEHNSQFTSSDEYIPPICRRVIIDKEWYKDELLDNLSTTVNAYNTSMPGEGPASYFMSGKAHPKCEEFNNSLQAISDDTKLVKIFELRDRLRVDQYASSTLDANKEGVDKAVKRLEKINQALNNEKKIRDLWRVIDSTDENQVATLKADIRTVDFWNPINEFLWGMLFLVPIFIISFFWNKRSLKVNNELQALISSHIMLIVSIPVTIKVFNVFTDIIPHKLLKQLWAEMHIWHLTAFWYYAVIALCVSGAILLIYVLQSKIFNRDIKKHIDADCVGCGRALPDKLTNYCPYCGTENPIKCKKCGVNAYKNALYCHVCGDKLSNV